MSHPSKTPSQAQLAALRWTVRLGAVTAEALAERDGRTIASARALMGGAERAGLLSRARILARRPALYTATKAGLRASGLSGFEPCRLSTSNAAHAIACAQVAAALERAYPDHQVMGERELRRQEHERGAPLASASLGRTPDGAPLLHRPDLVLWPELPPESLPIAVEVELTVKAPQRLLEICRAWARCRCVAGTLYIAAPEVCRPLGRAIERAQAEQRIVAVALDAVSGPDAPAEDTPTVSTVPSDA
jgi:hypothetical protein